MTIRMRIAALTLAAVVFGGCTHTIRYAVLGTREHSTTEGEARLSERDDGRYDVDVTIDRLPALDRLGEGLVAYVLWVQPEGAPAAERADVVTIDASTRTGHAHTVVSRGRFTLRVTAETTREPEQPSEIVVVASVLEPTE